MAKGIVRIATAGSVDNGKSTLIGRLLYDSKSIFEDQLTAIERASIKKGKLDLDLSLFTDGLSEEVELGITIDVAYRYFSTPNRKFILADTPGHAEFTRNMITGASTSEHILILIDATLGITEQTRRHSYIAGLLGLSSVIVCVNKMDLMNWDESSYKAIVDEYLDLSATFKLKNVEFVPISALKGDNVVVPSQSMSWYNGLSLIQLLEKLPDVENLINQQLRCLVQSKLGADQSFHYYGVKVLQGTLKLDSKIEVYPSRQTLSFSRLIKGYDTCEELESTICGTIVSKEACLARGDIMVDQEDVPMISKAFEAKICWLNSEALEMHRTLILQHVSGEYSAHISEIQYTVDMKSMAKQANPQTLEVNGIAKVRMNLEREMPFDPFEINRVLGSFILIDPSSNATVAAGMIS